MPNAPFTTPFTLPQLDPQQMSAAMLEALCPSDRPLVLLPVRLETRFITWHGGRELRVRVYPDKVHMDTHETELTQAEHDWGVHFWEQDWRAGNDAQRRAAQRRAAAWRQLADRYGAGRAAWIVRVLRPVNLADRPDTPVPPEAALPVAPRFSAAALTPDEDEASWRRAPLAALLPDRWIAIVQTPPIAGAPGVLLATGRDIGYLDAEGRLQRHQLPVGPDPKSPDAAIPGDRLAIDEDMTWMVDFDEAEARGMALRIPIPSAALDAGIEGLYVFGVASSLDPDEAAQGMARLLDAHHYTDGLDFLRPGTPSNNTAQRRAGYSPEDPGHDRRFAAEVTFDPATLGVESNATRLGAAFGLTADEAATVLGRIDHAAPSHERDARAMNTALWQVGWGYFLSNMVGMDAIGLTAEGLAWARDHFVSYVRSFGPYPALRCGRQPYGVLPVTSLDAWTPRGPLTPGSVTPDLRLRDLLVRLRDVAWRPHLADAARLGRRQNPPDPDADLADVMRLEGVSTGYRTRAVLGRHYLLHLRAFLGEDLEGPLTSWPSFAVISDELTGDILSRLGFPRLRISRATYADMSWRITAPLVQPGELSPSRILDLDYIGALLDKTTIVDLVAAVPDPAAPGGATLLQVLLRHALLREYADAGARIVAEAPDFDLRRLLRDEELVDLVTGAPLTMTWNWQLELVVPAVTRDKTIRKFLEGVTTFDLPSVRSLGECRDALEHLRTLDTETLQLSMQGTLDLSAHRLDAWITSFATRRLAEMRAAAPRGIRVGGYGWVENLTAGPPHGPAVTPPPGEDGPLVAPSGDTGFIHAPSLTHAATAALLRNAHLGHGDTPKPEDPFAIDLSSRRVREATWLLDGMRQQQPIGALLGYRLERRLHELGLDRYIKPIREFAPLTAGKLENTSLPLEAIAANNVVDGDALFRMWRDVDGGGHNEMIVRLREAIISAHEPDDLATLHAIALELDAIGEAIDAVSDALTAEAAYQIVRGNTSRTASTLKAIAEGDAPPPELEVTRTPRTGIPITHRVMVLFDVAPAQPPGWASTDRPRAAAEPVLNAWAARLLGDPRTVRCTVEHLDPAGEVVLATRTLGLSELMTNSTTHAPSIAPLDVVYGAGTTGDESDTGSALTDVEERVLYEARRGTGGFGPDARLRLQHARPGDLAADEITLFELMEQARGLRALFAVARAADPDDLVPPEQPNAGSVDVSELHTRTENAEDAFLAAHHALTTLVHRGADAQPEALRAALLALSDVGVEHSVPATATGADEAARIALLQQAQAVLQESTRRAKRIDELRAAAPVEETRRRRQQLLERMQAVFGSAFLTLPPFTNDDAAAHDLDTALAANLTLQDGDPLAVHTWFLRAERVRDNLARLAAPLRGAEILGAGERLDPRVAQLPFTPGVAVEDERWVGLPLAAGKDPQAGKLSLVVQADQSVDTAGPLTGLWVDEWVEVMPSREETTGIAFQFNPPDAYPPQTVLIAVPPDPAQPWTAAGLYRVLAETLDLAKLDMESLGEMAHYLPTLFLGFNVGQPPDAVSTDLTPLTTNRPP